MITNRMRRMSKRRQKIELARQARLVAQAVDLNEPAVKSADNALVTNVGDAQSARDAEATPAAR